MNGLTRRVGERLRARRQALGLSIRALAAASGLSERYVILAEKGEANLSLEKLQALGEALDLSLPALVSEGARGEVDALLTSRTPAELAEVASWLRARFAGGDDRRRIVALLGVRGAGKSTVGRRLAARLNREFVELDRRVEQAADLGLSELFALHGEDYYRRLEAEALERLIHAPGACVVATGGSIVTHPENYARLRVASLTIWLRATPEDHWDRVIRQGDRRPMRDHPHAMAELRALLEAREPLYRRADVVVETSGVPVEAVVEQVASALASGDALS
jgi:XRE family aerobic/anaerobic benzoate catabolism transcriptional regulator